MIDTQKNYCPHEIMSLINKYLIQHYLPLSDLIID